MLHGVGVQVPIPAPQERELPSDRSLSCISFWGLEPRGHLAKRRGCFVNTRRSSVEVYVKSSYMRYVVSYCVSFAATFSFAKQTSPLTRSVAPPSKTTSLRTLRDLSTTSSLRCRGCGFVLMFSRLTFGSPVLCCNLTLAPSAFGKASGAT